MTDTRTCSNPEVEHPGFPCAHPADERTPAELDAAYAELTAASEALADTIEAAEDARAERLDAAAVEAAEALDAARRLNADHDAELAGSSARGLCSRCGYMTRRVRERGTRTVVTRHARPYGATLRELVGRLDAEWTWPGHRCPWCLSSAMRRDGSALVCVGCGESRRDAEVTAARHTLIAARDRLTELGYLDGHPAREALDRALYFTRTERTGQGT